MRRHCDGTDPNLIREAECPGPAECGGDGFHRHWEPCNCGKVFDDVYTMVVYPHESF